MDHCVVSSQRYLASYILQWEGTLGQNGDLRFAAADVCRTLEIGNQRVPCYDWIEIKRMSLSTTPLVMMNNRCLLPTNWVCSPCPRVPVNRKIKPESNWIDRKKFVLMTIIPKKLCAHPGGAELIPRHHSTARSIKYCMRWPMNLSKGGPI